MSPVEKKTYTVNEVAQILGISRSSAYEATKRGDIYSVKIGRRVIVPKWVVDKMLEEQSQTDE